MKRTFYRQKRSTARHRGKREVNPWNLNTVQVSMPGDVDTEGKFATDNIQKKAGVRATEETMAL